MGVIQFVAYKFLSINKYEINDNYIQKINLKFCFFIKKSAITELKQFMIFKIRQTELHPNK